MEDMEKRQKKQSGGHSGKRCRRSAGLKIWRGISLVLMVAVAALGLLLYQMISEQKAEADRLEQERLAEELAPTPEPVYLSVTCYVPQGEPIVLGAEEGGSVTMPEGPEIPGYTFLGWADARGDYETRGELTLTENLAYSAQYAIAFRRDGEAERHEPYMSLDADGCFRPREGLSRGEAVEIVYALLDTELVGTGVFKDVEEDDSFFIAAATLKDLGVLGGSRLHPDEAITRGELFQLLSPFFPASAEKHEFEKVSEGDEYYPSFCQAIERGWIDDASLSPYDELTRAEAARIFNLLCGRRGVEHGDLGMTGTITDVSISDPLFSDIAEAAIPHGCEHDGDAESWTDSAPAPLRKPGLFFVGTDLRCIGSDGDPIIDGEAEGLYFDGEGIVSTGMPELDLLVRAKLRELVDPSKMSRDEMLKTLYNYVTYDCGYLRAEYYEKGETGWEAKEAYRMLSTGKGNCYSFAGAFWALARSIGYDAVCYSGTVGTVPRPHGWVEIEIDGKPYIFDPTLEYEERYVTFKHGKFYCLSYAALSGWSYTRG